MELGDLNDIVAMAVKLGRAVPANTWVEALMHEANANSFKGLM